MELTNKPFVAHVKSPELVPQPIAHGPKPLYLIDLIRRSAPVKLFSSLLSAFVDTLEPTVARFSHHSRKIAVELDNNDFAFYRVRGLKTTFLGNGSQLSDSERRALSRAKGGETELRLRLDKITLSTMRVPLGGVEYIEEIIKSRLDRLTPWKPEKVLYGFAVRLKSASDGQVDVDVATTSTDIAANAIDRLRSFDLAPSALGSSREIIDQRLQIDLFRGTNDTASKSRRRRIAVVTSALMALAVTAFSAVTYISVESAQSLDYLDRKIAAASQRLLKGADNNTERKAELKLIESRTQSNARFALLDRLAGILPDNTFLDEIDIQPGSLRLAGTSTEVSALIRILESEATLTDAKFSAPVTRESDGRDRFDITATLGAPPGTTR